MSKLNLADIKAMLAEAGMTVEVVSADELATKLQGADLPQLEILRWGYDDCGWSIIE